MGQFIILDCDCGFRSNRARVGSLLSHETSFDGFTVIEATFDPTSREIVMHYARLPPELAAKLDRNADEALENTVNDWFDRQSEIVREQHGPLLKPSSDTVVATDYPCPDCGRNLHLKTDGSWIA